MRGNPHVRFLGEGTSATRSPYPTNPQTEKSRYVVWKFFGSVISFGSGQVVRHERAWCYREGGNWARLPLALGRTRFLASCSSWLF